MFDQLKLFQYLFENFYHIKSFFKTTVNSALDITRNVPICVKSVRTRSFSDSYFPAFGLNTEEILRVSPYSVQMWENTDQKSYENGHFPLSVPLKN